MSLSPTCATFESEGKNRVRHLRHLICASRRNNEVAQKCQRTFRATCATLRHLWFSGWRNGSRYMIENATS